MTNYTKEKMNENNTVKLFFDECIVFTDNKTDRIIRDQLYAKYKQWCEIFDNKSVGKNVFLKEIKNEPYLLHEDNKKRFVKSGNNRYFKCLTCNIPSVNNTNHNDIIEDEDEY
jgi:phage/plasmid-associated DNA primase